MALFRWGAPLFKRFAGRWSANDFDGLTAYLRPYVPRGGRLLDLGGGTGELAAGLAERLQATATVLDATAQMLARVDPHPLVTVSLGRAEEIPFPDDHFDAVVCSDAFHHFRDQEAATREMARVVKPGGGVLVLELEPRGGVRVIAALERLLGEPAAFLPTHRLESLMEAGGIKGMATRHRHGNYVFLGSVEGIDKPLE